MIFNNVSTKGIRIRFKELEKLMRTLGFSRWSWDYHFVFYDYKYRDMQTGINYYLRLGGDVKNKPWLESSKAIVELDVPIFARHYFPHGIDPNVPLPDSIAKDVKAKVEELEDVLQNNKS